MGFLPLAVWAVVQSHPPEALQSAFEWFGNYSLPLYCVHLTVLVWVSELFGLAAGSDFVVVLAHGTTFGTQLCELPLKVGEIREETLNFFPRIWPPERRGKADESQGQGNHHAPTGKRQAEEPPGCLVAADALLCLDALDEAAAGRKLARDAAFGGAEPPFPFDSRMIDAETGVPEEAQCGQH